MYVFSSMATRLVLTTCSIHQLIVYVPYGVVLEKATLTTNRRHGRFKRHFRHILCALSTDPSVTHATPLCSLIATWPSDVNYVYWFNETTLEYELGDQTYYESCYYGSYTLMSNPYYTPPETIAAVSATPSPSPKPATQSCQVTAHVFWCAFSILIRVPYIGPSDCNATYDALESGTGAEAALTNWKCVKENGFIRLWFNAAGKSENINAALQSRYPSVNDFNCPYCNAL